MKISAYLTINIWFIFTKYCDSPLSLPQCIKVSLNSISWLQREKQLLLSCVWQGFWKLPLGHVFLRGLVGPIKCEKIWIVWQCLSHWMSETAYRLKTISVANKIKHCLEHSAWSKQIKQKGATAKQLSQLSWLFL